MLRIENLSYAYKKKASKIIDHLDMQLDEGHIGVLLGKNGSGKSTLLKLIVSILKPYEGKLRVDGKELSILKRKERANLIGYVPQDVTFGDLTVYETILLGRLSRYNLYPSKEDKEIVLRYIEEMNLTNLLDKNTNSISGGEKQKVAICMALVKEPKLLIFDEPTANLDIENELLILEEAKKLKEKGITILIALHDLNLALEFGDDFYLLKDKHIKYKADKNTLNEEMIKDVFDIDVTLETINNHKVVLRK